MKSVVRLTLSLLLAGFVFTSCSLLNTPPGQYHILGEWEWVESTGGFVGRTLTPDSPGFSERTLTFYSYHRFSMHQSESGSVIMSGGYTVEEKEDLLEISYELESGETRSNQWATFDSPDTLILQDMCADCYRSVYVRKE